MPKETPSDIVRIIDDYLKGRLNQSQTDHLWVLLMQNPEYYSLLETQAAMKRMDVDKIRRKLEMKDDDSPDGNEPYTGFVKDNKIPWIATLAAVIIIALFLNIFRSSVETKITPMISEIHTVNLLAPDISRSSTDDMSEFEQSLYRAYLMSISGNINGAIEEYEQLLVSNDIKPDLVNYNLAIMYYNSKDYVSSAERFQLVDCTHLNGDVLAESCYWFMTNSFLAINDLDRARDSASMVLGVEGYYQQDAIDLLRKIRYVQQNEK